MRKLFILVFGFFISHNCFSQTLTSPQIHRIGDYGKLWCVLNLFHPEMAYDKINADSLFTDNIGDLLGDPSAANFKNAVQQMINRLHDPSTTIGNTGSDLEDSAQLPGRSLLKWLDDNIALVYFDDEFMRQNQDEYNNEGLLHLIDTLKNANGIIIDLRQKEEDYYAPGFMQQFIRYIADKDLSYPASRSRIHYGHESQTFTSYFYYQGWVLQNTAAVNTKKTAINKPVCMLINRFNYNINGAIAAIQQQGGAKVIADDSLGQFESAGTYTLQLADSLEVNIRLTEVVYANGNKTFSPDKIIYRNKADTEDSLLHTAVQYLQSKNENEPPPVLKLQNTFVAAGRVEGYDSLAYPSAPLRLLGLMRYWSAIEYFCPNKDRIIKNWDSVLYEYVPQLLQAKDSLEYTFTIARLITEIHDGHGWLGSPIFSSLISMVPSIQLKYVDNKTIVLKVVNDSLKNNISPGDEIIAVDNIPVKKLRDSIAQYIGASNNAALQRDVTNYLLAGKENTSVKINLVHNGKPIVMNLPRNNKWWVIAFMPDQGPVWKKLNDKTGYVDLGRIEVPQLDSMFNDFKNTDAIIIDDRSYPRGTIWSIVNYLTDKTVGSAKGITMIADSPDPLTVTMQDQLWQIPVTPKPPLYKGKIIILVNETTQSQAEYSCMVLQAAYKKVTIIGSQTAGADGDVTGISIPGGIQTAFSGHGVRYPDGRPTQGIGIVPDIKILPTIKGIKEGRDEVLERAIEFSRTGK